MKDYYDDLNEMNTTPVPENYSDERVTAKESADVTDSAETIETERYEAQKYEEISSSSEEAKTSPESSYEWNATEN